MKLLQINCVYKQGSTGKIVYDIHSGVEKNQVESIVCYGRGKRVNEKNVYKTCAEWYAKGNNLRSRFTGIMYGGCLLSTHRLLSIIKRENPDIVHIHCINGYFVNIYRLISFLNKRNVKTVLTLHAEFMYTANCDHALDCDRWKTGCGKCPRNKAETKSLLFDHTHRSWIRMKKSFDGFADVAVVSVSPWLQERAQIAPILQDKNHLTIRNGVDTSIFRVVSTDLKHRMGLDDQKIVFHATAWFTTEQNHRKGGYYVAELAKRFLAEEGNMVFLVAGPCGKIKDIPDNVILLGNVEDQELLANYYSMSDVTLLTSQKETFSMVVAESLCCGTPVVGFEAGAPEMIGLKKFSSFVPYGDLNGLSDLLKHYLYAETFHKQTISEQAQARYCTERMVRQYQMLYEKMMCSN